MIENFLNNRFLVLYIFPFILGSLTVLSFQPFNIFLINFFSLPLFFFLICFVNKKSKSFYRKKPYKKNLFILGTAFGFGFYLSNIYWINYSLTFDENFKILIPFSLILIPLFLSLFFSLITLLVGPYLNFNLTSIFLLSASLAISDFVRAKVFTGFPWNLWVYSFSWSTEILQILNKIGLFAFNLIAITLFLLPSLILMKIQLFKKFLSIFLIILVFFAFYLYGNYVLNSNKVYLASISNKFNVKIISPNFDLKYGLEKEEIENRLKQLIRLSEPEKDIKTLFIWPEGVFSGYSFEEILGFNKIFSKNFSNKHFVLFGVNRFNPSKGGFYNSMIVVDNNFKIVKEYRKRKLVPFGEFLPFQKFLNKFGFKKVTEGYGSFLKGDEQSNLTFDKINALPLICYEVIFTFLTQSSDKDSNLIINISEDGWFGNSIGPYQHFAKGIFRSIEHNSYYLRSANKGISAIVNNKGQILKSLNIKEAGNIELEIPLIETNKRNKNDLIFFTLLITYILSFTYYKKNNDKK